MSHGQSKEVSWSVVTPSLAAHSALVQIGHSHCKRPVSMSEAQEWQTSKIVKFASLLCLLLLALPALARLGKRQEQKIFAPLAQGGLT